MGKISLGKKEKAVKDQSSKAKIPQFQLKAPKMKMDAGTGKKDKVTKEKLAIPFWRRIGVRLVAGFMVPVIFIVLQGTVSYQKASDQIVASYEESVDQTVDMINQYLTLTIDTVQSNYK